MVPYIIGLRKIAARMFQKPVGELTKEEFPADAVHKYSCWWAFQIVINYLWMIFGNMKRKGCFCLLRLLIWDVHRQRESDSVVKNLPAKARDVGLVSGSGRCPGEGKGYPLQYSCLGNPMDRGAWQATVYGSQQSQTQLSNKTTKQQGNIQNQGSTVWPHRQ